MTEDKQQTLTKLYSLRAGISAVASQRGEVEKISQQKQNNIQEVNNEINRINTQEIGSLNSEIESLQNENAKLDSERSNLNNTIKQNQETIAAIDSKKRNFYNNRNFADNNNSIGDVVYGNRRYKKPSLEVKNKEKSENLKIASICVIAVLLSIGYFVLYGCLSLSKTKAHILFGILLGFFIILCIGGVLFFLGVISDWGNDNEEIDEAYNEKVREFNIIKSSVDRINTCENRLNEIKQLVSNNKKLVKDKQKQIEEIKKKIEDCQSKIPLIEDAAEKACVPYYQLGCIMQEQFENEFNSFLNLRDWENLDVIIFAYESGRVETMKEALTYADEETRTDRIVDAINDSSQAVCRSIQSGLKNLALSMGECFSVISRQIAEQTNKLDKISVNLENLSDNMENLSENTANIAINTVKYSNNIAKLAAKVDYSNALQEQRNKSSAELVEKNNTFMLEARNYMHDLYINK